MKKPRFAFASTVAVLAVGALAWSACSDSTEPNGNGNGNGNVGPPANVAIASGDNQRVMIQIAFFDALVVLVTDADGDAVSGATVDWAITQGGGSLSAASSTTNANGRASVTLTAGMDEETIQVTASVDGVASAPVFSEVAVEPSSIAATDGDNQMARIDQPLANPLEVTVRASDNGPVPGATVDWQVTANDGTLSTASSTTDANGEATTMLTLGSTLGGNTVQASAGTGIDTNLNANGTQPVSVTVDMQNIAFNAPGGGDDVTIMLGDTVTWNNLDAVNHTATSNSVPTGGSGFDSGTMGNGATFSFVPNTRGEWIYLCEFHPVAMADARIVVQ
jgi:plastocyanin